ncbi:phosphoribosyltransferase [candidate division Kazan bacterium]|uniref:Phosphoribosyltransferase n=1 Tax=candidate division Kazan bacterium TaxID=2202143 RepID=A0A420ZAY5_UNCK3|nr:MAG: phosphoribosyltransferase [candidate division Kazan bacterium]
MEFEYVSWSKAVTLCYRLAEKILDSGYEPDTIVAVLRGGVVPALIISDYLGVEEFYAVRAVHWGIGSRKLSKPVIKQLPKGLRNRKLLIVDEVVDTGLTLQAIVDELVKQKPLEVKTAVLHVKPTAKYIPDYYAVKLSEWKWVFYPWSIMETLSSLKPRYGNWKKSIMDVMNKLEVQKLDVDVIVKSLVKRYGLVI